MQQCAAAGQCSLWSSNLETRLRQNEQSSTEIRGEGEREGGVSEDGEGLRLNAVVQIDIVPSQFRHSAARRLQQQEYEDLSYPTGTRWSVRQGQVYNIPQCAASHRQPKGP